MATLPLIEPSTAYPDLAGARTITVRVTGGTYTPSQLQTAFNDASADRASNNRTNIIEIDSNVDVTLTSALSIPAAANPMSKWVIVRSADVSSLPVRGTRVTVSDASHMPKLRQSSVNIPAIQTQNGDGGGNIADRWWFHGLEITTTHTSTTPEALIAFGSTGNDTLSKIPDNCYLDRCYVHGLAGNYSAILSRGVGLHCKTGAVVDCYISDIHNSGADAQAILGGAGPGPYLIQNNYLEASGENILFGGFDQLITNLIPSDITVRKNTFKKRLEWKANEEQYGGGGGGVKNLFELKTGQRVLIEGNYFSLSWTDGQQGWCFDLTPRNQSGGAPWNFVQNVTIRNNIIANVNQVFDLLATDDEHASGPLSDVQVFNNLFLGLDTTRWAAPGDSTGNIFVTLNGGAASGPNNFDVRHNTGFPYSSSGKFQLTDLISTVGWVFKDNLFGHGAFGWFGSGLSEGNASLAQFSGIDFTKNVLVGAPAASYGNYAGNFFPASTGDVGFVDFAGGDLRLTAASPYHNAASNGTDIGANLDAIAAATGINLPLADDLPPWVTSVAATPSTTSCLITFTTDELADTQIEYGMTTAYGSSTALQDTSPRVTSHSITVSGLTPSTIYHYRVKSADAAGNQTVGRDRTFTTSAAAPVTYTLTANPGSFTYTGQTASLKASRVLSANPGSFAFAGQSAALSVKARYVLTANPGTFTFTGQDATLSLISTAVLRANVGSFTFTGQVANLRASRLLTTLPGSFAFAGQLANMRVITPPTPVPPPPTVQPGILVVVLVGTTGGISINPPLVVDLTPSGN